MSAPLERQIMTVNDIYAPGTKTMLGRIRPDVISRALTDGGERAARALVRVMEEYRPVTVVADPGGPSVQTNGAPRVRITGAEGEWATDRRWLSHLTIDEHARVRALLSRAIGDDPSPLAHTARLLVDTTPQVWALGGHLTLYHLDGSYLRLFLPTEIRAKVVRELGLDDQRRIPKAITLQPGEIPTAIATLRRVRKSHPFPTHI